MPRKIVKPRVKYQYASDNPKAVDEVFDFLFNKLLEQHKLDK